MKNHQTPSPTGPHTAEAGVEEPGRGFFSHDLPEVRRILDEVNASAEESVGGPAREFFEAAGRAIRAALPEHRPEWLGPADPERFRTGDLARMFTPPRWEPPVGPLPALTAEYVEDRILAWFEHRPGVDMRLDYNQRELASRVWHWVKPGAVEPPVLPGVTALQAELAAGRVKVEAPPAEALHIDYGTRGGLARTNPDPAPSVPGCPCRTHQPWLEPDAHDPWCKEFSDFASRCGDPGPIGPCARRAAHPTVRGHAALDDNGKAVRW